MRNYQKAILCFILMYAVSWSAGAESATQPVTKVDTLKSEIAMLSTHRFTNKVSAEEIESLKRQAATFSVPSDSWAAILQLWIAGENDYVELLWWRKDDSETRAFIVALEWCALEALPNDNKDAWPSDIHDYIGMSARFSDQERAMRMRELNIVRDHHSFLRSQLFKVLLASKVKMAERYK